MNNRKLFSKDNFQTSLKTFSGMYFNFNKFVYCFSKIVNFLGKLKEFVND